MRARQDVRAEDRIMRAGLMATVGGNCVANTMTTKENLRRDRKCCADIILEIKPG